MLSPIPFVKHNRSPKICLVTSKDCYEFHPVDSILWVEVNNHLLKLRLKNGCYSKPFKHSLRDFYFNDLIFYPNFFYLSRSLIVNTHFVNKVEGDRVVIEKTRFAIPARNKPRFMKMLTS